MGNRRKPRQRSIHLDCAHRKPAFVFFVAFCQSRLAKSSRRDPKQIRPPIFRERAESCLMPVSTFTEPTLPLFIRLIASFSMPYHLLVPQQSSVELGTARSCCYWGAPFGELWFGVSPEPQRCELFTSFAVASKSAKPAGLQLFSPVASTSALSVVFLMSETARCSPVF
jgi:hypothetical protein